MSVRTLAVCGLAFTGLLACQPDRRREVLGPDTLDPKAPSDLFICLPTQARKEALSAFTALPNAITRLGNLHNGLRYHVIPVRGSECPMTVTNSCWSTSNRVYCDGMSLVRVQMAIAEQAATWAVANVEAFVHQQPVKAHPALSTLDAQVIADSRLEPGEYIRFRAGAALLRNLENVTYRGQQLNVEERMDLIRETVRAIFKIDSNGAPPNDPVVGLPVLLGYEVYEAAFNWFLVSLIGHESAHAHGDCDIDDATMPFEQEDFPRLAKAHQSCLPALNLAESAAEACAARAVSVMTSEMTLFKSRHDLWTDEQVQALLEVSAGIAIGANALALAGGLSNRTSDVRPSDDEINAAFEFDTHAAYSFPTLRSPEGHLFPFLRNELFVRALMKNLSTDDRSLLSCEAMQLLKDAMPQVPEACGSEHAFVDSLVTLSSYKCLASTTRNAWETCCRDVLIKTVP